MKNQLADSLVVSASMFIPPMPPRLVYEVQVKYRPSLPDNVKCWKVFEVDDQINRLLQVFDDFATMHIDQEKETFDKKVKRVNFQFGDYFLRRDALKEGGDVFDGPVNGLFFKL